MKYADYLAALNDYIKSAEPGYDWNDFPKGVQDSATWKGKINCIPYLGGGKILFYRTDLISESPKTMDEWFELVKKLTKPKEDLYGYCYVAERGERIWCEYCFVDLHNLFRSCYKSRCFRKSLDIYVKIQLSPNSEAALLLTLCAVWTP